MKTRIQNGRCININKTIYQFKKKIGCIANILDNPNAYNEDIEAYLDCAFLLNERINRSLKRLKLDYCNE